MKTGKTVKKDLYYTNDHDWIDFQGTIAYVGVCAFKLTGFKEIHRLSFHEPGFLKRGEIIATIGYNDYLVEVYMPVNGKLLHTNKMLDGDGSGILLQQPEGTGWLAQIIPSEPYERKGLLLPKEYRMDMKNR